MLLSLYYYFEIVKNNKKYQIKENNQRLKTCVNTRENNMKLKINLVITDCKTTITRK